MRVGIRVLCGAANSGKVTRILDGCIEACTQSGGAWLLVPSSADVSWARGELARRSPVLVGMNIGTFPTFVDEHAAGEAGRRHVPEAHGLLLSMIAARARIFPRSLREYPTWATTVRRTVEAIRESAVAGTEARDEAVARLPASERRGWMRLAGEYQRALHERGASDDASAFSRVIEWLDGSSDMRVPPVFAYGFDDLTHSQIRLLAAWGHRAPVTLTIPFLPGRAVYERRQAVIDELQQAGARITHDAGSPPPPTLIARVADSLFEPTSDPITATRSDEASDVEFVECCGALAEAEAIVETVARLVGSGVSPESIACVTGDPRSYRSLLESTADRSGLALTFAVSRSLADVPAGRGILSLVDATLNGDPVAMLSFMRSRISGCLPGDADRVELAWRPWLADAETTVLRSDADWLRHELIPDALRALAAGCADPGKSHGQLLIDALDSCDTSSPGDDRVLRAVQTAVTDSILLCGDQITLQDLRHVLAGCTIPAPATQRAGSVLVAPVERVRTRMFDAVIMFGLQSGGFAHAHEDEAAAHSRELAHVAITRARRHLRVVRQSASSDGRGLAPHPVWIELRRVVPDAPIRRRALDAVVPEPEDMVLAVDLPLAEAIASSQQPGTADVTGQGSSLGDTWTREMRDRARYSVTEVEGYLTCPAQWLIQRHLLGADPAGHSSRQVVGMLVHAALARLVPELARDVDMANQLPCVLPAASDMQVDRALRLARRELGANIVCRPSDEQRARLLIRRQIDCELVYGTVHTEQDIGGLGAIPALTVDGVQLTGRIDRYDVDPAGRVVVHDYKLTRTIVAGAKLIAGGKLQLPLYWRAIAQNHEMEPVAALYRPLEGSRPRGMLDADHAPAVDGGYANDRMSDDEIADITDAAMDLARQSMAGMMAGRVEAAPAGGSCPTWCDLQSICRIEDIG